MQKIRPWGFFFSSLKICQHHVWNKTISIREEFHSCHFYHTVKAGSLMNRVRTFTHTPHIEDTLVYSFTHFVYTGLQLHTFCLTNQHSYKRNKNSNNSRYISLNNKRSKCSGSWKVSPSLFFQTPCDLLNTLQVQWNTPNLTEVIIMQLAMTSLSSIGHDITEQYLKGLHRAPSEGATSKGRPAKPQHWCSPKTWRMSIIMLQPSLRCQLLCHRTRFVTLHDKIQIHFAWHFGSWWHTTIPTLNKIWTHRQTWWFQ